jgi:hypothetical protein
MGKYLNLELGFPTRFIREYQALISTQNLSILLVMIYTKMNTPKAKTTVNRESPHMNPNLSD